MFNKCMHIVIDWEKLLAEGGDVYQKLADVLEISRYDAKVIIHSHLYGKKEEMMNYD